MLLTVGKLISTTDMKLAQRLQKTVKIEEICGAGKPSWFHQRNGVLQMMVRGEFYELAEA